MKNTCGLRLSRAAQMLLVMLDSLRSGIDRSALADPRRHLGGRAGHLRGPGPSGLLEREIHIVADELVLAVDLQQALPDQLPVGRWALAGADTEQRAEQQVGSVQIELPASAGAQLHEGASQRVASQPLARIAETQFDGSRLQPLRCPRDGTNARRGLPTDLCLSSFAF